MSYAEVAVWLPVRGTYHYRVPERFAARSLVGARVLVPFGKRGVTGVVLGEGTALPDDVASARVRSVSSVLDPEHRMSGELIALCRWIAEYYEAPLGEVLRAAMPAGVQVRATARVELTAAGREALTEGGALSRRHRDVLGSLLAAGGTLLRSKLVRGPVKSADLDELATAELIAVGSQVRGRTVKPRTERTAVLVRPLTDDDHARYARAAKKLAALGALERAGGAAPVTSLKRAEPRIAEHLRGLAKEGLVRFEQREVAPEAVRAGIMTTAADHAAPHALNPHQRQALAAIRSGLRQRRFSAYLLFGITGSGKTEVYLHVIADVLAAGQTALVLVPEISLTPQLAARFRARFGDRVAVLHSGLTERQRFDEFRRLATGDARIALGARSAVFAPVTDLGVVVVDEEQDGSFKQDEGVRYHGRDVALVRAQRAGAVCILGSATPSFESFHAAHSGRYSLLRLPRRATPRPLPEVSLVDLRVYQPEGEAMLTAPLSVAIAETLARNEQVILFLNRRGFSTFVLCRACGHAFRCDDCSVTLTYHRAVDRLMCHYCGFQRVVPVDCPQCNAHGAIVRKGLGTEKVTAAIADAYGEARVARLDRDITAVTSIGEVLDRMARREIDVLVGTQMVTKGHDFPGVTLVGVLCADTGLSLPDFRAGERTFQLLTQVAGRAGRGETPGRVIIQSYQPKVPAVACAAGHDYEGFYAAECASRQEIGYPPFGYLAALRIDGRDPEAVERIARNLAGRVTRVQPEFGPGVKMLGPAEAPLVKLKGRTRWHLWLRAPDRKTLRRLVRAVVDPNAPVPGGVRIAVDIDPLSAL